MRPPRVVLAMAAFAAAALVAWLASRAADSKSSVATRAAPHGINESASEPTPRLTLDERQLAEVARPVISADRGEHVRGLVLDVDGTPRSDVEVEQRVGKERLLVARSAADGTFEASLERVEGTLTTSDGPWACVTPCRLSHERRSENHVLVVARAIALRGRVVDQRGSGVAAASIGVRLTSDVKAVLPRSFSAAPDWFASVVSDANGDFAFERVACVPGARLLVSRDPLQPVAQPLPSNDAPLV